jgi:hypothetical protein
MRLKGLTTPCSSASASHEHQWALLAVAAGSSALASHLSGLSRIESSQSSSMPLQSSAKSAANLRKFVNTYSQNLIVVSHQTPVVKSWIRTMFRLKFA